jgi:hypothetical protein
VGVNLEAVCVLSHLLLTALMDDVPNSHGVPTCSSMIPLPVSGKVKGAQDDVIQELQHKVHILQTVTATFLIN